MPDQQTKLKTFLKANHLVAEGVAKEAGVPLTDFYRYNSGAIRPNDETAAKISDALTRMLNKPVYASDLFELAAVTDEQ